MLQQEIRALQADRTRVPFSGSLPPGIHASLVPYRENLDGVYCQAITKIEMDPYPGSELMEAIY